MSELDAGEFEIDNDQKLDAYYNGKPLIVDDMFDRVELKLRWYGSKSVVKYPRCSLLRQLTYADAQDDASQVLLLATIWILILLFGGSACLFPTIYRLSLVYRGDSLNFSSQLSSSMPFKSKLNGILLILLGPAFGYQIEYSTVRVLKGLWTNDLTALKGDCPNCGEEVKSLLTKTMKFTKGTMKMKSKRLMLLEENQITFHSEDGGTDCARHRLRIWKLWCTSSVFKADAYMYC